jgi:putative drug exporter of the RND superfamily
LFERLAHLVIRRRRWVVAAWIFLLVLGLFTTSKIGDRWFESFSIPGYSAYEANQRTLKTFGSGAQAPFVAVFRSDGDVTKKRGIEKAIAAGAAAAVNPGSRARTASYFSTGSDAYVSKDRHTTFATIYPPGTPRFDSSPRVDQVRAAIKSNAPPGVTTHLTGRDPLQKDIGGSGGPSVLVEVMFGVLGALLVLLLVFGTLTAVSIPLVTAAASILTTFSAVFALTYVTNVSIVVEFLVALVGLGVSVDYSLLMIFRFREELHHRGNVEEALVETMTHAGRSVVVSGSTVAIGLLSMVLLPLPFIRSIGIGGMLIPAVAVLSTLTLTPALLYWMGTRIDKLRVIPKRIVSADPGEKGFWHAWADYVVRRPGRIALAGLALVVLLLIPAFKINPSEAEAKNLPGSGDAFQGRDALGAAGLSEGALKPYVVLVEHGATPQNRALIVKRLEQTQGIDGASAPPTWQKDGTGLVEAIPSTDGAAKPARKVISNLQHNVLPDLQRQIGGDVKVTLGGVAPEDRDFVHAVYGNFPYVLGFVVLLTFLLLMRAFRSVVLSLKAVILNLISLGCALGVVVFIFQQGHGSDAIWGIKATQAVIAWIPLMIFAFLFGLSMDYEVFIVTRIREAYDETKDTAQAISLGIARTGKLVTSAALVLVFAFFSLSTGPGPDIKQFGIGLAAGVLIDATLIRALLVPSLMMLLGKYNWWFPEPVRRVLRVRPPKPAVETD